MSINKSAASPFIPHVVPPVGSQCELLQVVFKVNNLEAWKQLGMAGRVTPISPTEWMVSAHISSQQLSYISLKRFVLSGNYSLCVNPNCVKKTPNPVSDLLDRQKEFSGPVEEFNKKTFLSKL